jgi:hypothetical protein
MKNTSLLAPPSSQQKEKLFYLRKMAAEWFATSECFFPSCKQKTLKGDCQYIYPFHAIPLFAKWAGGCCTCLENAQVTKM